MFGAPVANGPAGRAPPGGTSRGRLGTRNTPRSPFGCLARLPQRSSGGRSGLPDRSDERARDHAARQALQRLAQPAAPGEIRLLRALIGEARTRRPTAHCAASSTPRRSRSITTARRRRIRQYFLGRALDPARWAAIAATPSRSSASCHSLNGFQKLNAGDSKIAAAEFRRAPGLELSARVRTARDCSRSSRIDRTTSRASRRFRRSPRGRRCRPSITCSRRLAARLPWEATGKMPPPAPATSR